MTNSDEAHTDHIVWRKNEANDETNPEELLDTALGRILTILDSLDLLAWSEEVEKGVWNLPHTLSHKATPKNRETQGVRLGHSYLYRTKFGQMNVWAVASPTHPHNTLTQICRDTEFLPMIDLCLQSLLQYFTGKVLQVDRVSATVRKP